MIIRRSRKAKQNNITIIIDGPNVDHEITERETKKMFRRMKHLLGKEMSFMLIINRGSNHKEEIPE